MEKNEMSHVYKFLDVVGSKDLVGRTNLLLFAMEAMACLANNANISLEISASCALVIFMSMFMWGEIIKNDSKFLFLYLSVECSVLSLCFMLTVLGASNIDLLHGCIAFTVMLVSSIPCNIYFVKRKARKILSGQVSQDDKRWESLTGLVISLSVISGCFERQFLTAAGERIILIVSSYIAFYIFEGCAIMGFYKEIIRRRYNININNLLKQQSVKLAKKR